MDWAELRSTCLACQDCALAHTRSNVVFGGGNEASPVLFVGEGPGEQEDRTGLPFVGRAGQLLDDMLSSVGLDRSRIFITNIVKCRPPENRDPLRGEMDACLPHLRRQTLLLHPNIIVCLGRVAAKRLIDEDFKLTQDHGKWYERQGIFMTALFHPSALWRDPRRRPETFADLKSIAAKIDALGLVL